MTSPSADFGVFGSLRTSSGIFGNDRVVKNSSTPRIKISRLYLRKSWQVYSLAQQILICCAKYCFLILREDTSFFFLIISLFFVFFLLFYVIINLYKHYFMTGLGYKKILTRRSSNLVNYLSPPAGNNQ